jgi:hypothetical protein
MKSSLDSDVSHLPQAENERIPRWLRLGIVAGASALAGGVAAAWWYRKTLIKLRQAENRTSNAESRNLEDDAADEG